MLRRSSFEKRVLSLVEGTSVVTASIQLSGQRECVDSAVDVTFTELVDGAMEHIYGPILEKLSRLSGELPFVVSSAAIQSPMQAAEVTAREISRVITEIKAELEMR